MKGRVLIAEDDTTLGQALKAGLAAEGFELSVVTSGEQALEQLDGLDYDVLLADLVLEGMDGLTLCKRCAEVQPGVPVIVMTGFGSLEAAVDAIRAGAYDFLSKPVDPAVVALTLERAIEHRRLNSELRRLRRVVEITRGFGELLGESPAMQELFDLLARVAETDVTVLVTGESGTGKELVARALHHRGPRHNGPFVPINCAALPEGLLESELFGHAAGAFTGARQANPGLLVEASGGTLFLDEIGDMPMSMQSKLLRALQEQAVRPVGGRRHVSFDARIVAATHRDLEAEVEASRFREDLYYRLNVVQIALPPLRARGRDRLLLAHQLLERLDLATRRQVSRISAEAAEKILAYDWPGNVRELRNCIERAVALTRFDEITVADLPKRVRDAKVSAPVLYPDEASELVTLAEVEKRYILRVLEACGGQRAVAARTLAIDRKTLRRKLKSYGA